MDKDTIKLARQLITTTTIPIDMILAKLDVTQEQYRKQYPETPVTVCLALDILDAKEKDSVLTLDQIAKRWSLTKSQVKYAVYNVDAIIPKQQDNSLKYIVLKALREDPTRTQTSIADANDVSQSYVHNIAKEHGLLRKRKKRVELTDTQLATIFDDIDKGISIESLAKAHGVARDTLYKKLRMREST